jgi:CheY-like chemotaxis protein
MPRILIVDDNYDSCATLAGLLKRDGYKVGVAADGDEALKAQAKSPFDVLITDIFMPVRDGVETIREFRVRYPQTRIIAMSGSRGFAVDYLSLGLTLGADRVLRKPFDLAALREALKEILDARHLSALRDAPSRRPGAGSNLRGCDAKRGRRKARSARE